MNKLVCNRRAWLVTAFGAVLTKSSLASESEAPSPKCEGLPLEEAPNGREAATVIIPLKSAWAYKVPGTKDIRQVDKSQRAETEKKVEEIRDKLVVTPRRLKARPAFVVPGVDSTAFENAYLSFLKPQNVVDKFTTATALTLVVFSKRSSRYFYLDEVKRIGSKIHVSYHYISHPGLSVTEHFALVPLGKLEAGTYQVLLAPSKKKKEFEDGRRVSHPDKEQRKVILSESFEFTVTP